MSKRLYEYLNRSKVERLNYFLDILIMLQYTLKLFHKGVAILVREEIRMYY